MAEDGSRQPHKPHTAGPWKTSLDADPRAERPGEPTSPFAAMAAPHERGVFEGTLKWVILIALFFGLAMLLTVILRSTGGRPTGF
jgi:hypothetical protein